MKFSDKLIELRKKSGLSQEQLADKLDVTRQTISKWELGQTSPDIDKLTKISKIFNVNMDELVGGEVIKEEEIFNGEKQEKKDKNRKNIIKTILIILLVIILSALIYLCYQDHIEKKKNNPDYSGGIFEVFDKIIGKNFGIKVFNKDIESYNGNQPGLFVSTLIDKIENNVKRNNYEIVIVYDDVEYKKFDELRDKIDESGNYIVSFEYNKDKFINKVFIKRKITEFELNKFNMLYYHMYNGTLSKMELVNCLDSILGNNRKSEHKIDVRYNDKVLTEEEIRSLKKQLDESKDYEVEYNYDTDGFINEAIVR